MGSRHSSATATTVSSSAARVCASSEAVEHRLRAALWSFFAGDALASPTHWFYGGPSQIQQYYGLEGITGYRQPVYELAGSILNKSNLNGGGRRSETTKNEPTIIGHVINHGKQDLWSPNRSIHYHATLQAGEPTLEAQLARVLMKSMVANGGKFVAEDFRQRYIDFMTTKGSHNDTYASTCHRMFFANFQRGVPPADCPDNDGHNVDTVDGLVLPTMVSLAAAVTGDNVASAAAACASVTRQSPVLDRAAAAWGLLVQDTLLYGPAAVEPAATAVAKELGLRAPRVSDHEEMTACYLSSALPALLDSVVSRYRASSVWQSLLLNANTGGENVHRGSCLGAVLGAAAEAPLEPQLMKGLYQHEQLDQEINAFVAAVMKQRTT